MRLRGFRVDASFSFGTTLEPGSIFCTMTIYQVLLHDLFDALRVRPSVWPLVM